MSDANASNLRRPGRSTMVLAVVAMLLFVAAVVGLTYWTSAGTSEEAQMPENTEGHSMSPEFVPGGPDMPMPAQDPVG